MSHRFPLPRPLCGAVALTGCASQINHFSVSPYVACAGEPVTASWDVGAGQVALEADRALPGLGPQPRQGRREFALAADTRFTLKARGALKTEQSEVDVRGLPAASPLALGGLAACERALGTVAVTLAVSDQVVTPASRALTLTNPYPRLLIVSKDGVEAALAPHGTSERFKDRPAAGRWRVAAPLAQGESCAAALEELAHRLTLQAQLSCGR
jgi:hypothetical protein